MADQIRVHAQAQCSPDALWHTLVENRAAWWPELEFSASPGAPLSEGWGPEETRHSGTVLAVAPGRLLSFRWTAPDWNAYTVVSFQLAGGEPDAGPEATDVTVTESGLAALSADGGGAQEHTAQWSARLADLISRAEGP